MHPDDVLAQQLLAEHEGGRPFTTLARAGARLDLAQAYAVQDRYVSLLGLRHGAGVVGYKIGLTSPAMQQMCGIGHPIHGRILSSRVHAGGARLALAGYGHLGLEFEIAVRLARDLREVPADWQALAPWVDAICPAIELVDDRGADYAVLDAASLVADNAWSAGVVLGDWAKAPDDLRERAGQVRLDGAPLDAGRVGDALDHPFASVHWLATQLAAQGRTLAAGMIVMTGSIVRTRFPSAAGRWQYAVEGLGEVALEIAAD